MNWAELVVDRLLRWILGRLSPAETPDVPVAVFLDDVPDAPPVA